MGPGRAVARSEGVAAGVAVGGVDADWGGLIGRAAGRGDGHNAAS